MADYYVNSATASVWVASAAVALGARRVPSRAYATAAARAWTFECTVAGTTAATEPTWPTTDGATVVDGGVTWTARIPSTWANAGAHTDYILSNRSVAGDRIFLAAAHSESTAAAYDLIGKTSLSNLVSIICAGNTSEPPTILANTAVIATTGSNPISVSNGLVFNGVNLRSGIGGGNVNFNLNTWSSNSLLVFENCLLEVAGTGGAAQFAVSATNSVVASVVLFKDTKLKSSGTASYGISMGSQGRIIWDGGSVDTTWSHAGLIGITGIRSANVLVRGVDLSLLGSGKNLVTTGAIVADVEFVNCKLGAGVNVVSAITPSPGGVNVKLHNCDSAATNYRYHSTEYVGQSFSETTIVKTGGSTDGTTAYSIKMLSSENSNFHNPLTHDAAAIWNDTTATPITVTVDIVHDGLTALTDGEVWLDVDYAGTSTSPISTKASGGRAILAAATAQTSSASAWTTTGLANPNKQKLEVTFTPQMKGYLLPRIKLAKPSYTVYVDNKAVIT